MLSLTRRRLFVLAVFVAIAVFAGLKFGTDSRAAKPKLSTALLPSIGATMTAAPTTDVGSNGAFVNPGDTIEYTVTINNGAASGAGNDATNTIFTDNLTDANLTLVPGSVKASPIAFDETFSVTGNVRIQKAVGTLLSNDIRPTTGNNTGLTITALGSDVAAPFSFTTTNGGTVTAATGDGSFQYNPPPGFEGTGASADSFTYTITDPDGLTGTGTVKLDVSGMIWFVNTSAASNGDGRLTSPYNCFVGAGCFDPAAADDPGDNIFLYTGGTNTGGITLLANQKLIGQGASATLASISGITLAADSDALPATGGTNPVITTGGANGITLGSGGNVIRGLTVGNVGGGTKIFSAGPFGTVTIGNNTTPDVALSGTGKALDLTNGSFGATSAFSSVATTSSTTHGMQLITVGGTVAFGSTSVSGSTAQGIFVNNSGVNLNFGNTTVGATGGSTECVRLETNTGGTRTFGTLGVTNCTAQGITISGAGNVNVTGQTTVTTPGSVGILANTLPGANTITFTNVTVSGSGGTGVSLSNNTGAVSFADLDIAPASGQIGLDISSCNGTVTSTSGTISASAPAIVSNSGTLAMVLDSVSSTPTSGAGVNLTSSSGSIVMNGGSITGNASGRAFLVNSGTVTSVYKGSISQANNTELVQVTGGHNTGTIQFDTGTLSATNGTGLLFDNADGNYTFNGPTTLNGGDAGIDITTGSSGQFSFGSGTTITNPSGIAYREDTSTANVNIDGTISKTNNAANAVSINAKSGGLTSFNGGVTATTTTANAINLTSNTGGAITFGGGLALSTTSGIGFNATGGGTVIAAQTPPITVNTIASTTGTALNVANTNIGASGLTFRSISSNGSASGIVLNATGASGGLAVSGDTGSTNNNSGGTIQNTTSHGISLTNTQNVSLDQMNIQSTGDSGINGTTVTNFAFTNGTINNSGNALGESNIAFNGSGTLAGNNISGTLTVTGSTLTNAFDCGIHAENNAGTISNATFTGNTITSTTSTATSKGDGIRMVGTGNASTVGSLTKATINNNTVRNFPSAAGIQVNYGNVSSTGPLGTAGIPGDATNIISITGNTVRGFDATNRFGTSAILVVNSGGNGAQRSRMNFDVSNNGTAGQPIGNSLGTVIGVGNNGFATTTGTVNNNFIVANNTVASQGIGGGNGITLSNTETPDLTLTVNNNNISAVDGNGILLVGRGVSGIAKLAIKGNTVAAPLTGVRPGIRVDAGNASSLDDAVCIDMSGNTTGGSGTHEGIGLRKQGTIATTNDFGVEGMAATTSPGVEQFVGNAGLNPGAANGAFGTTGVLLLSATSGYSNCNTAPIAPPSNSDSNSHYFSSNPLPGEIGREPGSRIGVNTKALIDEEIEIPFLKASNVQVSRPAVVQEPETAMAVIGGMVEYAAPTELETPSAPVEWALAKIEIGGAINATPSSNVEWAQAVIDIVPASAETGSSTFGAIASLVDKMASQISPTVYSQENEKEAPVGGGTVTVNGAGSGFTLPAGKSTTIKFRAAISNPTTPVNTFSVSNQGTVSGTGFGPILTDDPGVAGAANPTVTTVVQPPTITKSFTPANILLDQQSTLTITINNTNPATAVTGITVTDTFPANVVVASPLTASTTCGAGTLQDSDGNTLAPGDVGIKLVGGTRNAAQSCTVTVAVRATIGGSYVNTTGNVASFEGFVGTTASSTLNVSVLTASELSISGRVTTSQGRGIRNARVVITGNSLAQPISVFTGVNGTYSVEGLAAGETYIVTVMSRRFAFESPSRVVTLIDNVTDADFIGSSGTNREQ